MDGRLGSPDEIRLDFAIGQAQDFHPTRVVAAVPLDIDIAGFIGALTERGWIFGAIVTGDDADRAQSRPGAGIFQKYGAPPRGHDDGFAEQADVAGTDEMVAPRDALLAVLEPVLAAPAVAVELDDLLNEVPGPDQLACWLEGVHPRAQHREVDAIGPGRGRGDIRLAAVDLPDTGPLFPVENVVVTGRRADMDVFSDPRWRGDIVAVPRPAARGKSP